MYGVSKTSAAICPPTWKWPTVMETVKEMQMEKVELLPYVGGEIKVGTARLLAVSAYWRRIDFCQIFLMMATIQVNN